MIPLVKLVSWVLIACLVSFISRKKVLAVFVGVGIIQVIIGFGQFVQQKGAINLELARIFLGEGGGLLLRAYGTFPHPNILAGFLVLGLVSSYYFYLGGPFKVLQLCLRTTTVFIILLGLTLTFSRAGWLVAALATAAFLYFFYSHRLALTIILSAAVLFSIFHWAVIPRITTLDYQNFSVQERLSDYDLAWQAIKEKPLLGHGLTLSMGERPIHNLYLLITKEIGLLGLAAFIVFIGSLYRRNLNSINQEKIVVLIMLSSLLVFGLFDHFLWTLRPGAAMLWLTIGMLL